MDNCFEAARLAGVQPGRLCQFGGGQRASRNSTASASSTRTISATATCNTRCTRSSTSGRRRITARSTAWRSPTIRPANVTGPDKIVGSVDHVFCITEAGARQAGQVPVQGRDARPVHVDEIAEIFARVVMKDKPEHAVYNTGGQTISLGEIADIVREFLPDAQITFEKETGGRELSGNFMIDNSRVVHGIRHAVPPLPRARIADHQRSPPEEGKPPITAP